MTQPISSSSETDFSTLAGESLDSAKDGIADGICAGTACIRSNPLGAAAGLLAVGIILGYLVSHRNKPTLRTRYIDEPLEDLQHLAHMLSRRAARHAGRGNDAAMGAVDSILHRIKSSLKF